MGDERNMIALHEAAHAVIARALGVRVTLIDMTVPGVWHEAVLRHDMDDAARRIRAIIALAGPVSENIAFPERINHLDLFTDRDEALAAIRLEADDWSTVFVALLSETTRLVRKHWYSILHVADALMTADRMEELELDCLIARGIRRGMIRRLLWRPYLWLFRLSYGRLAS